MRPIHDEAQRIVEDAVDSDVPLLAGAGKIGLAAMMLANQRLIASGKQNIKHESEDVLPKSTRTIEIDFKGYFVCRFEETHNGQDVEMIWNEITVLRDILKTLKNGGCSCGKKIMDMTQLKAIHKKLKYCRIWGQKPDSKKKKRKKKRQRIG